MTKKIIAVTLSGNSTIYFYTCPAEMVEGRRPGDRVVIVNKVKDGGELSLSIGTFQGINETGADTTSLKPAVQFIDADKLMLARVEATRQVAAS